MLADRDNGSYSRAMSSRLQIPWPRPVAAFLVIEAARELEAVLIAAQPSSSPN